MSARISYFSTVLALFSAFLRTQQIGDDLSNRAKLLLTDFFAASPATDGWNPQAFGRFLQSKGNLTAYDRPVLEIVNSWLEKFPPHQTNVALHHYLLALKADHCSASTIKNYRSDIGQFLQFASESDLKSAFQKPKVIDFLLYQKQKGLKLSSVRRKLVSMTQFALWAEGADYLAGLGTASWITQLGQSLEDSDWGEPEADSKKPSKSRKISPPKSNPNYQYWVLPLESVNQADLEFTTLSAGSAADPRATTTTTPTASSVQPPQASSALKDQELKARLRQNLRSIKNRLKTNNKPGLQILHGWMPYINLLVMLLFLIGGGALAYLQFGRDVDNPLAYPTSLTRPNRTLSFQGRLTDIAKNPVINPTDMRFRLFDSGPGIVGGNILWDSGTCSIDPDDDGIFSTGLGDECGGEITDDVFTEHSNVWLQVEVDNGVTWEILDPRQSIKTVPYALNAETVQGYPASASAVENTILVMDNNGDVVLGNASPTLRSTGSSFTIEAQTLTLQTASGSNGDIILSPDGLGEVLVDSDLEVDGYISAPGATLSANYVGGKPLVIQGLAGHTANLTEWSDGDGNTTVIDENGNIGIGTTNPDQKLTIAGGNISLTTANSTITGATGLTLQETGDTYGTVRLHLQNRNGVNGAMFEQAGTVDLVDFVFKTLSNQRNIRLEDRAGSTFAGDPEFQFGIGGNPAFLVSDSRTVVRTGNLGIGTTAPSDKLHVAGDIRVTGALKDGNNETGTAGQILSSTGTGLDWIDASTFMDTDDQTLAEVLSYGNSAGSYSIDMNSQLITNIGHTGTDFTASGGLTLAGDFDANGNVSIADTDIVFDGASTNLNVTGNFSINTDDLFVQKSSGNVGIGTTAPAQKLHLADGTLLVDTPTNPTLVGSYGTNVWEVFVSGKYAYVAGGVMTGYLQIVDISNPASLSLVGTYNTSGSGYGVYVSGKYAYVADGIAGLLVIDISNPISPSLVGTYNTSGSAYNVYVSGKYAYVADDSAGLQVIDISDPTLPSLVGNYNTSHLAREVYVSGKYAYVADYNDGLHIIDVSNPASLSLVGTYNTSGTAVGVYVSGKYAYVADGSAGLRIVNVSNPSSPTLVGTAGFHANDVYVSGKYAYLAGGIDGLRIVNVSNPSSPTLVGSYDTAGVTQKVHVSGKYAYIADLGGGLRVIDIKGADISALHAGNIQTNDLTITENGDVGNNLYVRNALNVGAGGIMTDGSLTAAGIGTIGSTLSVYGNTIGLNNDASANNILSFGSVAGGAATGDLYWGDKLLCDASELNCGISGENPLTFENGLTRTGDTIRLGGALTQSTSLSQGTFTWTQNFTGTTTTGLTYTANSLTSGSAISVNSSSLSSGSLMNLAVTGTAAASNSQKVLNISNSGSNSSSNQMTYGVYANNTRTGTGSTNVGGYFSASGGANNFAALFGGDIAFIGGDRVIGFRSTTPGGGGGGLTIRADNATGLAGDIKLFAGSSSVDVGGSVYISGGSGMNGNGNVILGYDGTNYWGSVGIGTASPTQKLDIDGQIRIRGGSPATGRVLVTDANGVGTWTDPATLPAGSVSFTNITGGTNASAAMVVGSGASLNYSGTGTINASTLAGQGINSLPYVNNTTDATLTRTGAGPYTLGLNLANANNWTATQTFSNATYSALFTGGNVGIGTTAPASLFSVGSTSQFQVNSAGRITSIAGGTVSPYTRVVYVDANGKGDYTTLNDAIAAVTPTSTNPVLIKVGPGTFTETSTITLKAYLSIEGAGIDQTIITGATANFLVSANATSSVSNLSFNPSTSGAVQSYNITGGKFKNISFSSSSWGNNTYSGIFTDSIFNGQINVSSGTFYSSTINTGSVGGGTFHNSRFTVSFSNPNSVIYSSYITTLTASYGTNQIYNSRIGTLNGVAGNSGYINCHNCQIDTINMGYAGWTGGVRLYNSAVSSVIGTGTVSGSIYLYNGSHIGSLTADTQALVTTSSVFSMLDLQAPSPAKVPLSLKGVASQTANLFQINSSAASNGDLLTFNSAGNLGIGTTAPTQKLDIDGQIRIRGGSPAVGRVLVTDANGVGTWTDPATLPAGSVSFTNITSGTNTTAAMVVGSGASLNYSGTGTINASTLAGQAISALPYVNDATNATLTRTGAGPYTLGLNLGNANNWTATQTFSNATYSALFTGGNVGIGTTSPTAKLHVNGGSIVVTGADRKITAESTSGSNTNFVNLWVGSTLALFQYPSNLKFGIQAASTQGDSGSSNYSMMSFGSTRNTMFGDMASSQSDPGHRVTIKGSTSTNSNAALNVLNSSDTNLLYVRNDGNIGIGTTSPVGKLNIDSGSATGQALNVNGIITNGLTSFNTIFGTRFPTLIWDTTDATGYGSWFQRFGNSQNSGANTYFGRARGTSDGTKAAIQANDYLGVINNMGYDGSQYVPSSFIRFQADSVASGNVPGSTIFGSYLGTTPADYLTIRGDGLVGIGTTSPTQKLDIDGQIRIRGGSPAVGRVLVTDANGVGTWTDPATLPSGSVSFTNITSGTNTTAAMVVGTGASLNYSGTGTINATTLAGQAISALPYVNDATNATLTRTGAGPYTLGLNLANANTWTGAQTFSANTYFPGSGIWDTSGNVGIGTTTITSGLKLQVVANGSSSTAAMSAFSNTVGHRGSLMLQRARGTSASPTVVQNNDELGDLLFSGYDGSNYQYPGGVVGFVDGTPSSGNIPLRISFRTGTNSGNRTERLQIGSTGNINFNSGQMYVLASSGNVGIGTTVPNYKLSVIGPVHGGGSSGDAFIIGNDTKFVDVDAANTLSIQGIANNNTIAIRLGSTSVPVISRENDRVKITPGANNIAPLLLEQQNASNNIVTLLDLQRYYFGATPGGAGLGAAINFNLEDSASNNNQQAARIDVVWDDATDTSEDASFRFNSMSNGTLAEIMRVGYGGNVGIGTTAPTQKLDVNGQIRLRGGSPAVGRVLVSDVDGVGTWTDPATLPAGSVSFTNITSGTNTTAAMVVGTGASLNYSGTGTINASTLAGQAISALPYVNDATNATLTRTGAGPYTLGLNLGNANTWTATQTFSNATYSALFTGGNVGIGTTTPASLFSVGSTSQFQVNSSGKITSITGGMVSPYTRTIVVDAAGKGDYTTLSAAIAAITPSSTNRYLIKIMPGTYTTGWDAPITLKSYITITGAGKSTVVGPFIGTGLVDVKIDNVYYYIVNGMLANETLDGDIVFESSFVNNIGIANGVSPWYAYTIGSGVVFRNVIGAVSTTTVRSDSTIVNSRLGSINVDVYSPIFENTVITGNLSGNQGIPVLRGSTVLGTYIAPYTGVGRTFYIYNSYINSISGDSDGGQAINVYNSYIADLNPVNNTSTTFRLYDSTIGQYTGIASPAYTLYLHNSKIVSSSGTTTALRNGINTGTLGLQSPDASIIPGILRGATGQTANLFEIQNAGGTALSVFNAAGNLGLGTTTPSDKLHVAGDARLTGALKDVNNQAGTAGQILSSTATGVDWIDASTFTDTDDQTLAEVLAQGNSAGTYSIDMNNQLITNIGNAGTDFTAGGGLTLASTLTASNGLTLTTGALSLTSTSGALSLSGLSASSISTGANALTITSSNFNTTSTGINSTAIGATTASTGAFTTLSSTGATTLGNNSANVAINSNIWDITGAGVASGLTGLSSSGTVSFSGLTADRLVSTTTGGQLATSLSSANAALSISDETGSGLMVFNNAPTFSTGSVNFSGITSDIITPGNEHFAIMPGGTGNVGIGTTSPVAPLEIATNTNSSLIMRKTGSTGMSFSSFWPSLNMNMYHNGSNWVAIGGGFTGMWGQNPTSGLMTFSMRSTTATAGENLGDYTGFERMAITAAGNIGIGTTGPTQLLDVNGQIRIRGGSPAAGRVLVTDANGVGTWTDPATLPAGSGRWDQITNPTANKAFAMSTFTTAMNWATGTGANNLFSLTTDSSNGTGALLNVQTQGTTLSPLRVRAGSVEALAINGSGNVGIGTTAPENLLSLVNRNVTNSQLTLRSQRVAINTGNILGGIDFTSNDTNLTDPGVVAASVQAIATEVHTASAIGTALTFSTTTGTTYSEKMRIAANGNVGIGTTTTGQRFVVRGVGNGTAGTANFLNSDNRSNLYIRDDGRIGIGTTSPNGVVHVVGIQPATAAGTGAEAIAGLRVVGGVGGDTTSVSAAGGIGSAMVLTGGIGGIPINDSGSLATGGAGGALNFTGGIGGAPGRVSAGNTGGAGGALNLAGGAGGSLTVAATGNNTGGVGGALTFTAGAGGSAANASGTNAGGAGGALTLDGGTGGIGTTSSGSGGGVTLRGGLAAAAPGSAGGGITLTGRVGSTTGSGGAGGGLTFTAGAAGGDNTVNRAGGAVGITAGASRGTTAGGAINLTAGAAGINLATGTATGGTGGGYTFTLGTGGTASNADVASTGGAAGTFTITGGVGGAASVAGTGNNTGGTGSPFSWIAGTGGAANGATSGTNAGGAGGAIALTAGTGGAATVGTGALNGGVGGALTLSGGNGGLGVSNGGNGGLATLRGGAAAASPGGAGGGVTLTGRAGSTTGSGGVGGALTLTAGAAGGDNTVNRAGGAIGLTAGASIGPTQAGGAISLVTGAAGINTAAGTATGPIGGGYSFTMGAGGVANGATTASTGGAGGTFTITGGVGGAASVAGTGNNTGGTGSPFSWIAGTGGAANGATSGTNAGGAGGGIEIRAGTGGAATVGSGARNGGVGGTLTLSGGTGGAGTTTGTGGPIVFRTASTTTQAERMRIAANGNIGIGTTGPTQLLDISGQIRIRGGSPAANRVLTSDASGVATWTDPTTLPSGPVRWDQITNPTANKSFAMSTFTTGFNWATGTGANNLFSLTTDSSNGTGALLNVQTQGTTMLPLRVRAGAVEAITVSANGNVGVGMTASRSKLNTSGGLAVGSGSGISTVDGARRSIQITSDTNYGGTFDNHSGFLVYSTMDISWGHAKLNFARSTNWGTYDSTPTLTLAGLNVGMGTTDPTQKLHVVGSGYITAGLSVGDATVTSGVVNVGTGFRIANAGTSGRILRGNGTNFVASTATYPDTTTANQLLYSSAANTITGLTSANNSFLTTNGSGVPGFTALSADTFTQYALLAGRAGGQTLIGSTSNNSGLTLRATSNGAATTGADIIFQVGNNGATEAMRILNNGNIGIGTTNPGTAKLAVMGGNMGVGVTAPTAYLDIAGTSSGTNSIRLRSGDGSTVPADSNQILLSYNNTADYTHAIKTRHNSAALSGNAIDFYLWSQGVDSVGTIGTKHIMTLDGTGNVGIGSTVPGYKLDVAGTGRFTGAVDLDGDLELNSTLTDINGSAGTAGQILSSTGSGVDWIDASTFTDTDDQTLAEVLSYGNSAGSYSIDMNNQLITNIGNAGTDFTAGGGLTLASTLTASNGLTLTTGALNLTATSGVLSLSGLSASSISTGANALTVTSSNFNTTATGINSTAIGATTPSTGAFTTLSSTGATTLGNNSANVTINSNIWDITGAGVASGLTGLSSSGTVTFSGLTADRLVSTTTGGQLTTSISSANAALSVSDETGSGLMVFNNAPTFSTGSVSFSGITSDITTPTNEHLAIMPGGTGNVGVGTTSPGSRLEVTQTSTSNGEGIRLNLSGNAWEQLIGGGNALLFQYNNTRYLSLATDGSMYVGGGSNAGTGDLHLADRLVDWDNTNYYLDLDNTGIAGLFAGNVGIGTTTPGERLVVQNSSGNSVIQISANPSVGGYVANLKLSTQNGSWNMYNWQNNLYFEGANGVGLYIKGQDNNIGIGTTDPSTLLQLGTPGTKAGTMSLAGSTSGLVTLQTAAAAGTYTLTLPTNDGDANQVLSTNGSGVMSWVTPSSGSVADDSLDFDKFQDTLDLDANLILNQGAFTWTQNFTGTTTTGLTYNANSLTSGTAISVASSSLSSGSLMNLAVTGTAAASNSQKVLNISNSGANATSTQTTYGVYSTNTRTGTGSTNVGGYFSASGGANNYAAIFANGNVGIGTTTPSQKLDTTGMIVTHSAPAPTFAGNGSIIASGSNISSSLGVLMGVNIPYVTGSFGGHILGYSNDTAPKWLIGMSRNASNEDGLYYFEDSSAAQVRLAILPGGNVGIGTTSPGSALEVTGNIRITPDNNYLQLGHSNAMNRVFGEGNNSYLRAGQRVRLQVGSNNQLELDSPNVTIPNYNLLVSNGNIGVGAASPSTLLQLGTAGTKAGTLSLAGGTSGLVTLQTAAAAGTYTLTLPTNDGDANQVLSTNGSGVMSWVTPSSGSVADDSLDFDKFQDTLDLDANLILNQGAFTWTQNFTGTTTTGLTYNANSLTTGTGISVASSSLSSGSLMNLAVTGTAAASNTQKVLNISNSGANATSTQTTYGVYSTNTRTGTSSTNVGGYFSASGGTNNYALQVGSGNIEITHDMRIGINTEGTLQEFMGIVFPTSAPYGVNIYPRGYTDGSHPEDNFFHIGNSGQIVLSGRDGITPTNYVGMTIVGQNVNTYTHHSNAIQTQSNINDMGYQMNNVSTGANANGLSIRISTSTTGVNGNQFVRFLNNSSAEIGRIRYGANTTSVVYATTGTGDFAEWVVGEEPMQPGDIIAFQGDSIGKADKGETMAGIYSTYGAFVAGEGDANHPNAAMLAMSGITKMKVNTSNGAISTGDPLTISSTKSVGMKATKSGQIVAKAMKSYSNPNPNATGMIDVLISVGWYNTGENDKYVLNINEAGQVVLDTDSQNYQVTVRGSLADNLYAAARIISARVQAGLVTTKDLVAQTAQIGDLSLNSLKIAGQPIRDYIAAIVTEMQSAPVVGETPTPTEAPEGLVAPEDSDTNSPLAELLVEGSATISGTLTTDALMANTIAANTSLLGELTAETATIAGDLKADNIYAATISAYSSRLELLEAKTAEFENIKAQTANLMEATVSGTLYASNIYDFENKIANSFEQPGLIDILKQKLGTESGETTPPPGNPTPPGTQDVYDSLNQSNYEATSSADLNLGLSDLDLEAEDVTLTAQALFIENYFKVNGAAYIADSIGIGNKIFIGQGTTIADGSINYSAPEGEDQIFDIQPSGRGAVSILAGLMTLTESGQVEINGDLRVAGSLTVEDTLLSNLIQPADFGNPFQVQVAGISDTDQTVKESRFEIINELGSPVATISAQGRAAFADGIDIGSETLEEDEDGANPTANKSSGKATIAAGTAQIIIETTRITKDTLIYVTPVGSTNNQVLYVKSQRVHDPEKPNLPGRFIVGFDQATTEPVQFNWWLVN